MASARSEFSTWNSPAERQTKNFVPAGSLDLRFRWGEIARLLLILKSGRFMGAIAERFVRGVPATAESERSASGEAVGLTLHVDDFEIPFDAQRAVIPNDNLG
jgi:hypothetical protein